MEKYGFVWRYGTWFLGVGLDRWIQVDGNVMSLYIDGELYCKEEYTDTADFERLLRAYLS